MLALMNSLTCLLFSLQLSLFAIAFSPAYNSRRRSSALSPFSFQRRRIAVPPLAASTLAYKEADGSIQTKTPVSQLEDEKLEGGGGGDDDAVNVVLVTGFESFNRDLYEEAGRMLPKECEISLKGVFHCSFLFDFYCFGLRAHIFSPPTQYCLYLMSSSPNTK